MACRGRGRGEGRLWPLASGQHPPTPHFTFHGTRLCTYLGRRGVARGKTGCPMANGSCVFIIILTIGVPCQGNTAPSAERRCSPLAL
jgi:hypothetical protein